MSLRASESMSSTARLSNEPTFKIELQRNSKSTELRRLRGNFTFDQFISVIRNMWNSAPRRLIVEYTDEDGDRIRIGSELEWEEAVAQSVDRGLPALRLFVRRYKGGKDTKPASDSEDEADDGADATRAASDKTASDEPRTHCSPGSPDVVVVDPPMPPPASVSSTRSVPALDLTRVASSEDMKPKQPEAKPAEQPAHAGSVEAPIVVDEEPSENELTIDLLSRLYDCDAAREMMDVFSSINFAPVVTRRVDGVAQEVHVDVDRAALRHLTVMRTNQWIGNKLYEKAETTLEAALKLWPEDSVILYNVACSSSLRGDVPKAMDMLKAAVDHGFDNLQQLRSDPDLEHTRDHPDYVPLLRHVSERNRPKVAEAKPAATKPQKHSNVHHVAPELVAQVIAMFPDFSEQDAVALLVAHNNNIRAAINSLLGSA